MINPISTALSGALAASKRLDGAASNVANERSSGSLKPKGDDAAYTPIVTAQEPSTGGGTLAYYRPQSPPTRPSYEPDSPHADSSGLVAEPNVDDARETVGMLEARRSHAANLKTIQVASDMQKSLLSIIT